MARWLSTQLRTTGRMHKAHHVRMEELRRAATDRLPPPVSEYVNQGSADGITVSAAVASWDRVRFRPRILRDVSVVSTVTTVLGRELATPVCVAPTTLHRAAHPDGEVATARGARAAGSLMAVSSNAGTTFEEIGATGAAWWLQCYVLRDRGLTKAIAQRAQAAGASAVVLTADTPVVGRKHNAGQSVWDVVPADYMLANIDPTGLPDAALDKADDMTPDTIGWLREASGLPVVVKGVLRADDARIVTSAGAAAIQVSNHGGRQLDQSVATADALPEIAAAVEGSRAEVYVDGGIRSGEHVLAAMALGARAVFVGRPVLWALAAGGESGQGGCAGVAALLSGLTAELGHAMALAGARTVSEITNDLVA
jgi:4-hydroxymandelate oxidase